MTDKTKNLLVLLGTLVLVGIFFMFGSGKFIEPDKWIDKFANWGYPAWFVFVAGSMELAGAIGLLIPVLRGPVGIGLTMFMIGAVGTHVVHNEIGMIFVAGAILIGSAFVGWYRLPETLRFLRRDEDSDE